MIRVILGSKLVFSIFFYLLWGASFFTEILGLGETESEIFIWVCNLILFIFWLIVFMDMIRNDFRNKILWIIGMIILPFFTPIVYIFRRKNLVDLRNNNLKSDRRFK